MNAVEQNVFVEMEKKENQWEALMAEKEDRPLTWEDLQEEDIRRFSLENSGRCYAANPPLDRILEPLRRVYDEYREKAEKEAHEKGDQLYGCLYWNGEVSDPKWPSSVMLSELQAAAKEGN